MLLLCAAPILSALPTSEDSHTTCTMSRWWFAVRGKTHIKKFIPIKKKLSALTPELTQHPTGDLTVKKDSLRPSSYRIPSRPPASSPEPGQHTRLQQQWVAPGTA